MELSSTAATFVGTLAIARARDWLVQRIARPFTAGQWKSVMGSIAGFPFRCRHKHLSRPVAPVRKRGVSQGETYVVCLDCGTQFAYDTLAWQVGKPRLNSTCCQLPN